MKKSFLVALGLCAIFATKSAVAEDLEFMLINQTSDPVVAFYVSHAGTEQWEENILPDDGILAGGYEIPVIIADGRDVCVYDVRSEFESGDALDGYDIDLCELGSYTIVSE